jgi:hypothetical protein
MLLAEGRTPPLGFFVSVADKGLAERDSTSVASTRVTDGRLRSKPEETRSLIVSVALKRDRRLKVQEKQIPPFGRDDTARGYPHPLISAEECAND